MSGSGVHLLELLQTGILNSIAYLLFTDRLDLPSKTTVQEIRTDRNIFYL